MPRIFISYRRDDAFAQAREIAQVLISQYGADRVFFDQETLIFGEDFFHHITTEIHDAAAQIVVMGPQWLTIADEQDSTPRLWRPKDVVAFEVKTALHRGIPIIPIVLDQAPFPQAGDLPRSLKDLAHRHGKQVHSDRIAEDLHALIQKRIDLLMDDHDFVTREFPNGTCITGPICHIKGGTFQMGSANGGNEGPVHSVTLGDFAIARYPVTVQEYAYFIDATKHAPPSDFGGLFWDMQRKNPKHPVVNVTWHDAIAYAGWLAKLTEQAWRLPTEAEWEYAARWDIPQDKPPHGRIYPWGDTWDAKKANTADGGAGHLTLVTAHATGKSPFGVQDLVGNAWEWTSSLNAPYPYTLATHEDLTKTHAHRIHRGGSWRSPHTVTTTTRRTDDMPTVCNPTLGFRLALG
jgi:formylglycine-generating enzyme required for sulfatase activity